MAEAAKEGEVQEMVEPPKEAEQPRASEEMELDELEVQPQTRKRRGKTRLIIDKRIKLNSDFLRARIDNIKVELRYDDFTDAIIDVRTPAELLLNRPASGGCRFRQNMATKLTTLFTRILVTRPLTDRLQEYPQETEVLRHKRPSQAILDKIVEAEEPQIQQVEPTVEPPTVEISALEATKRASGDALNATIEVPNVTIEAPNVTTEALNVTIEAPNVTTEAPNVTTEAPNVTTEAPNVTTEAEVAKDPLNVSKNVQQDTIQAQVDIADMLTQKLEEEVSPPKRRRQVGYMSFRESQEQRKQHLFPEVIVQEIDKENVPPNADYQPSPRLQKTSSKHVSTMLEQAGLMDVIPQLVGQGDAPDETQKRKEGSEDSETPLGSLDRTKVSLGDSVNTTDSQRWLRHEWGIEGTMKKVLRAVRAGGEGGAGGALCVTSLVSSGPAPAPRRQVAARCFSSLLKLKHHGFIRIDKNPETLEIVNIRLGPRFDNI